MSKLVSGEETLSSKFDLRDVTQFDDEQDQPRLSDISKEFRNSVMLWLQGVFECQLLEDLRSAYLKEYVGLNEEDHPKVCLDVGDKDRSMYTVIKNLLLTTQICTSRLFYFLF